PVFWAVLSQCGDPERTFICGPREVWVYGWPGDVEFREHYLNCPHGPEPAPPPEPLTDPRCTVRWLDENPSGGGEHFLLARGRPVVLRFAVTNDSTETWPAEPFGTVLRAVRFGYRLTPAEGTPSESRVTLRHPVAPGETRSF